MSDLKTVQLNERILLIHGDMRECAFHVPDADLVLTDPPYAMQYQSNHRKNKFDQIEGDDSVDRDWFWMCDKVKRDGALYCFHKWTKQDIFKKYIERYKNITIRNQVIWAKNNDTGGDLRRAFGEMHESIWFATGENFAFPNKRPSSVQYCARVSGSKLLHPNQKPIQLIRKLVSYTLDVNDQQALVFDPFMGSGTTGVVAAERGYRYIGIEMSKTYFDLSVRRISDVVNQMRLF